jgi:hypothetical protein
MGEIDCTRCGKHLLPGDAYADYGEDCLLCPECDRDTDREEKEEE